VQQQAEEKDQILQAFLEEQRKAEEQRKERGKEETKRRKKKGNKIAKMIRDKVILDFIVLDWDFEVSTCEVG
jgi:uncharacterized FlaG/YvyC family protein